MRLVLVFVLACVSAATFCDLAGAAPADLDHSLGGDGIVELEGPSGATQFSAESAARMAIGPEDEIFVLYSNHGPCEPAFDCKVELTVVRYEADGSRDTSFGTGGPQLVVRQNAYTHKFDIAVGPDGRPVITAFDDPEDTLTVARLGRDGRLDASFGVGGVIPHNQDHTIEVARTIPVVAVQADGKIVIAGEGDRTPEGSELIVARLLPNGQFDPGFGVNGEAKIIVRTQIVPADVLLGPTGTITVPGPMCCIAHSGAPSGEGFSVGRLLADGRPDPGWPVDGSLYFPTPGAEGAIEGSALAPDGSLFVSFEESTSTVSTPGIVAKLKPDGSLDPAFGKEGKAWLYPRVGSVDPSDIAVDQQGRLVGVGWQGRVALFRLRPDGSADRTFNGGRHLLVPYGGDKSTPYQVGLQSSGRIVALAESGGGAKGFALIGLRGGTDHSRCLGHKATIVGTQGPDELVGTPHRDVIAALGGKDEVRGLGGADLICGGKGHDKLLGGPGRDRVRQ